MTTTLAIPTTNNNFAVTDLDFDSIKQNLINFLQGQSEFSDFNYQGSGLNILLEILAYNTSYNALYVNLGINEMFLDSAVKRNSVVSLAKNLGYCPQSAKCSTATLTITVTSPTGSPASVDLPAGSQFTGSINGKTYNFYTQTDYNIVQRSGVYQLAGVQIFEGTPLLNTYTVAPGSNFLIPNQNADLGTLTVQVKQSSNSMSATTYQPKSAFSSVNSLSQVYYVSEVNDGLYQVYFGDGTLGIALNNGNVVILNYMVSDLDTPNGISNFSYAAGSLAGGTVSLVTTTAAFNGSAAEGIDSIKFRAPLTFASQNRAVTIQDYMSLIPGIITNPQITSMNIWGGEDVQPPVYGKVFLSLIASGQEFLTLAQKQLIINTLTSNYGVLTIIPTIVDPTYLNLSINSTVYYNNKLTNKSLSALNLIISNTISNYNTTNLLKFNSVFRYSNLCSQIDQSDLSFVSDITTVLMIYDLSPVFGQNFVYQIALANPIYQNQSPVSISSTGFTIQGQASTVYFEDDGLGSIKLYYFINNTKQYIPGIFGTVDYQKGNIALSNFIVLSAPANNIQINIVPESNDIVGFQNTVLQISNIITNVVQDPISSGSNISGNQFVFTPSR